ncbi:hypothetical protein [Serratia silvae]|uniref:ASCH domain-containing protein n=1 Tax=Serratia silvae TaxID=2824122 RepID=A0ABT0K9W7_9GAMM|nr:hypothetical protein [Serratia silvae]MCL1028567.1 hypothetical protein [Serratia silvae]
MKKVEIRSWLPPQIPLVNVILVENYNFIKGNDVDPFGKALAIVDIVGYKKWTLDDFECQNYETKQSKRWKDNYFMWELDNIREFKNEVICEAKTGIYTISLDDKHMDFKV